MTAGGVATKGSYRAGIRTGMPFVLPTAAIGLSFGVLTRSLGWDLAAPIVMSLIVFSGSAQFASASVLGAGGSVVAAVVAAALVNARFLMMGIARSGPRSASWPSSVPRSRPRDRCSWAAGSCPSG